MRTRLIVATVMLAVGFVAAFSSLNRTVEAYPEPSIVPTAWQFDFTWSQPGLIALKDIDGEQHWYWYVAYKVVNNTGEERNFFPEFTLATDMGDIINAGQEVPASAFELISKRLGNPHIQKPIEIVGQLLQGEDYAKSSLAIWPAPKHDVDQFNIFVAGLSGETKTIEHPITEQTIVLTKTLMLSFDTPGTTAPDLQGQEVIPTDTKWVMR